MLWNWGIPRFQTRPHCCGPLTLAPGFEYRVVVMLLPGRHHNSGSGTLNKIKNNKQLCRTYKDRLSSGTVHFVCILYIYIYIYVDEV